MDRFSMSHRSIWVSFVTLILAGPLALQAVWAGPTGDQSELPIDRGLMQRFSKLHS